jgi:ornithine decarboxylase
VGSSVTDPAAYRHALSEATDVLNDCDLDIRLVDVGGGFPRSYPGFEMPPLNSFFTAIREAARTLPLPANGEILGEPGRALAGPGMSAVSEVLQRKDGRLYINDGMHGIFWELRYKGHKSFPVRCYRNGELLAGSTRPFTLIGPTCDSEDVLPGTVDLPADIRAGDYIESGRLGAYSLSGRTDFNGRYSTHIVMIDGPEELPPGHLEYRN